MADKAWDWTPACFPSPLPYCFPSTQPGLLPNSRTHVLLPAFLLFHLFIHSFSKQVKVKSLSRGQLFATPWGVAHQDPLSMGFSRQEYWSGLSFPSPGDLPDPGIEPGSPALQADALPSEPPGKQTSSEHKLCARHCIATKVENDTDRSKGLCPHRANSLQG